MQLPEALHSGKLLRRYKRFLADVELANGDVIVAHCPNPGSMLGCAEPGSEIWLRHSTDPKRKLPYTWVVTNSSNSFISVDTLLANKLMKHAFANGQIPELAQYKHVVPEYTFEDSRFDFLLKVDNSADTGCLVEVKSTTMVDGDIAMFPDAKTERGRKHLSGLMRAVKAGYRAVQFYCIARNDVSSFKPAEQVDPKYAQYLREAASNGVEVLAWTTSIAIQDANAFSVELARPVPVIL